MGLSSCLIFHLIKWTGWVDIKQVQNRRMLQFYTISWFLILKASCGKSYISFCTQETAIGRSSRRSNMMMWFLQQRQRRNIDIWQARRPSVLGNFRVHGAIGGGAHFFNHNHKSWNQHHYHSSHNPWPQFFNHKTRTTPAICLITSHLGNTLL